MLIAQVSIMTLGIGTGALVAGFFGMNVGSGLINYRQYLTVHFSF